MNCGLTSLNLPIFKTINTSITLPSTHAQQKNESP